MFESRIIYIHPGQELHYVRPGDVVLPIESHPSIIDDSMRAGTKQVGRPSTLLDRVVEYLERNGIANFEEMSGDLNIKRVTLISTVNRNPEIFDFEIRRTEKNYQTKYWKLKRRTNHHVFDKAPAGNSEIITPGSHLHRNG